GDEARRARVVRDDGLRRVDERVWITTQQAAAHQHHELLACRRAVRVAERTRVPPMDRLDVGTRRRCTTGIPEAIERRAALIGGEASPQQLVTHLDV